MNLYNFRAESLEEKNNWLELIEDAKADAIEGRMKGRAGSIPSIGKNIRLRGHTMLLSASIRIPSVEKCVQNIANTYAFNFGVSLYKDEKEKCHFSKIFKDKYI